MAGSDSHAAAPLGEAQATTLDDIFRRNVRRTPDAVALVDPPDRASFTDGHPRTLTYAQADRAVSALAARLQDLALPAGAVVGLQMPNTVESLIALLGVLRAGLIAAPLPLLWREAEAAPMLREIGARALISCRRVAGMEYGELALQLALSSFGIRFVCAFGDGLPDGVVALDEIFSSPASERPPLRQLSPNPAEQTAVITFDLAPAGLTPVARSHPELLAGGVAVMLEAGIPRQAAILASMLTASFSGLATIVVPWLLSGGSLALHQPFDAAVFAAQCEATAFDAVVLPGPLVPRFAQAELFGAHPAPTLVAVWRTPERHVHSARWQAGTRLVDILVFGETGVLALRRGDDGAPGPIVTGPVTAPTGTTGGPVVMTITRLPGGTVGLGGPMVPRARLTSVSAEGENAAGPAPAGWVDTGYACRVAAGTNTVSLTGPPPGIVSVGGYRFSVRELQDMVGRIDPGGSLAALPDMLSGQKLAGTTRDQSAVRQELAALGINPLVGSAFRDRRRRAPAA